MRSLARERGVRWDFPRLARVTAAGVSVFTCCTHAPPIPPPPQSLSPVVFPPAGPQFSQAFRELILACMESDPARRPTLAEVVQRARGAMG